MQTKPFRPALAAILLTTLAGSAPALAGDQTQDATGALPGVKGGYTIVKPLPEPDEAPATTLNGLHLKIGNVEVKVRGSVIIDAGAGQAGSSGKGH